MSELSPATQALSPARWSDSEELFGPRGACAGYPIEPKAGKMPPPFIYTGLASAFGAAGFTEVARRSETRPIFRYVIGG